MKRGAAKILKRIEVRAARPGMILGTAVFARDGNLLVDAGTPLTAHSLDLLDLWGILEIEVAESTAPGAAPPLGDVLKDEMRRAQKQRVGNLGRWVKAETKRLLTSIADGKTGIDSERLKSLAGSIVDESTKSRELMLTLTTMLDFDTYLFSHAVHVSILSVVIGIAMGLSRRETQVLAAGGLLMDLGMLRIERSIWDKSGPLTDEEFAVIKKHPAYGVGAAERYLAGDKDALAIVAQHHERLDGSGYPRRLGGKAIHPLARIAAVCDVYNAMQAPRSYRKKWLPYQVMGHLLVSSAETLDSEVVKVFLRTLAAYPIGSFVRLDTGQVGVVVSANRSSPIRPVVKVFQRGDGAKLDRPEFIDLNQDKRFIVGPVDPHGFNLAPFELV